MTREEKLISMRMQDLVGVAEKLGIKINVKAAKSQAVEKILAAENNNMCADGRSYAEIGKEIAEQTKLKSKLVPMPGTTDPDWGKKAAAETCPEPVQTRIEKPKRGQLIEYKGKAQNICAWAKELNKSANTLYARIYRFGWSIEDAFNK